MSYIGSKRSSSLVSTKGITLEEVKLAASGNSITKSDGTTAVLSESGGVVTLTTNTILEAVTDAGVSIEDVTIVGNKTVGARDDVTIEILQAGNYILRSSGVSDQLNLGDQLAIANGSNHIITSIGWTHPVNKRISKIELWGYWPTVTSFQAGIVRQYGSTNQGASFFASESKAKTADDAYISFDIPSYSISRSDYYYAVRIIVTNTSGAYVYYRGIRLTYVNF